MGHGNAASSHTPVGIGSQHMVYAVTTRSHCRPCALSGGLQLADPRIHRKASQDTPCSPLCMPPRVAARQRMRLYDVV